MSRLTDLYKRVMYGQAGMDMPGQGMSKELQVCLVKVDNNLVD
jgi:hypothetical protein